MPNKVSTTHKYWSLWGNTTRDLKKLQNLRQLKMFFNEFDEGYVLIFYLLGQNHHNFRWFNNFEEESSMTTCTPLITPF